MLRVLVVDDLCDAADSLALLLRLWGYEAVIAYSGADALDVAAAILPDVVLLDLGLPRLDGFEVARRLRQIPGMSNAVLIAITGFGREADVQGCREAGFDYHFLKPVDHAHLRQVLDKAQERRQIAC